ncbi:MAG: oligosaccharide flippase family protein [Candidatus Sungbacteria bacterium]|uniref:Oligosaccharide flippase family protein n=1 Tax=Candidatus Sungiibacteriota bacterium TaxID=2750080 RepID=A0A9D6LPD4_9BACT|nr:oligosaccharide flippase family protein [Candidatus Sungbacteria bacterium]
MVLDKKSFSRNVAEAFAWSSAGSWIIRVVGIFTTVLVLAQFSLRDYGTYQLVLAAWGLLFSFSLQGVDQIVVAEGARITGKDEYAAVLLGQGYFLFKLFSSAILFTLLYLGAHILSGWYSLDIVSLLKVLSLSFIAVPFERLINYHLARHLKFFQTSLYTVLEEVSKFVLIAVVLLLFHFRIGAVLAATALSAIGTMIVFIPIVPRKYFYFSRHSLSSLFHLIIVRHGKWNIFQKYIRQTEKNIRPIFVEYFIGREGVALFSVAEKLFNTFADLFPISDVLTPILSTELENRARLQRTLERVFKYTFPLLAIISTVVALVAPFILAYAFPQYIPALSLFNILLFYIPFLGLGYTLTSLYFSQREQKEAFYLILIRFGLYVVTAPLLLKTLGLWGVAIEYSATLIFFDILRYWSLVRIHPELTMRFGHLFSVDGYDRAVLLKIKSRLLRRFSP